MLIQLPGTRAPSRRFCTIVSTAVNVPPARHLTSPRFTASHNVADEVFWSACHPVWGAVEADSAFSEGTPRRYHLPMTRAVGTALESRSRRGRHMPRATSHPLVYIGLSLIGLGPSSRILSPSPCGCALPHTNWVDKLGAPGPLLDLRSSEKIFQRWQKSVSTRPRSSLDSKVSKYSGRSSHRSVYDGLGHIASGLS